MTDGIAYVRVRAAESYDGNNDIGSSGGEGGGIAVATIRIEWTYDGGITGFGWETTINGQLYSIQPNPGSVEGTNAAIITALNGVARKHFYDSKWGVCEVM